MKVEGKKKSNVRRGDWSRERPGVGCAISPAGDMWSGQQVISITYVQVRLDCGCM